MTHTQILAIDPGGTTGIALRLKNGELHTCTTSTKQELFDVLYWAGIEQIVYENFAAEKISKYGLWTVRLIGAIEMAAYQRKIPITEQVPAFRRTHLEKAKEALRGKGVVVHEIDATAHLLKWESVHGV